ncbi:hypothetical protein [Cryobacterium sp.]|uniref:hypothetical protein n=1 Tax=Cryobacterium sp. TaxID=1926290 RepID=UPI002620EA27|nr:hypothetical protein [Cryobacterium sp.]
MQFVHLSGSLKVLGNRLEGRSEHFMPPALLQPQLATLEELHDDEPGFAVDIAQPVLDIVTEAVARLCAPALPASVTIGTGGAACPWSGSTVRPARPRSICRARTSPVMHRRDSRRCCG